MAEALKINNTLTTIELGYNDIGVEGAKDVAEALKINKTLTTIHLERNYIGSEGAKYLAWALEINKTLTTIHLYYTSIGATGQKHLAEALKINKTSSTTIYASDIYQKQNIYPLTNSGTVRLNSSLCCWVCKDEVEQLAAVSVPGFRVR